MRVIIDSEGEVLVFPETILEGDSYVDEMDKIRRRECLSVPVYRGHEQIPGLNAFIRRSNRGKFGDGVLRAGYDRGFIQSSKRLKIEISPEGFSQICLTQGGADYVSTSKSGVRRIEFWATYADQNPFKNLRG